jgi:valyl-tRNA synthetase
MIGEPRPITHPVKFYEKGDRPLEIVTSRSGSSRRWVS